MGQIRRRDILKIGRDEFVAEWPVVVTSLFAAVDFVRTYLRVPVSLLPYNALLVPFTYFFYRNNNVAPSDQQEKMLGQYFWWASLSNRYSSAVENKVAQDLERINQILASNQPSYRGDEVYLTLEALKAKWFSTGDSFARRCYACMLTRFHGHLIMTAW